MGFFSSFLAGAGAGAGDFDITIEPIGEKGPAGVDARDKEAGDVMSRPSAEYLAVEYKRSALSHSASSAMFALVFLTESGVNA